MTELFNKFIKKVLLPNSIDLVKLNTLEDKKIVSNIRKDKFRTRKREHKISPQKCNSRIKKRIKIKGSKLPLESQVTIQVKKDKKQRLKISLLRVKS